MTDRTQPPQRRNGIRALCSYRLLFGVVRVAAALGLSLSTAQAQGLRSATASVSLVVIKPATDESGVRTRDGSIAIPSEWASADEITVESDVTLSETPENRGFRLFVRDATHRLVELRVGAQVRIATASSKAQVRLLLGADEQARSAPLVRAVARWRDTERREVRLLPVAVGAP